MKASKYASGRPSAWAIAGWKGAPLDEREVLLGGLDRGDELAGPVAQPIFQPVTENVLPAEESVTVRSAIPGSVASGTCSRPSKVRCS